MRSFFVTVRIGGIPTRYIAIAESAGAAWDDAFDRFANTPCRITVMPRRVP